MNSKINIANNTLGILGFISIVFILYVLKPLIMPLLFAMILGVMIFPVQKFFEKKWRFNRLFATLFSIFIIFSVSAIVFLFIFIQLQDFIDNGENYAVKISELYKNILNYIGDSFNISNSRMMRDNDLKIETILKGNTDKLALLVSESGSVISDLILIPIYLFFFLYYRRFFRAFAYKLFNKHSQSFVNSIIKKVFNVQKSYLSGLLKVMLIVGTLNSIGLLLLGIDNAIFFGFFAAFLILIPYIGVIIGSLLPALVALATKDSAWYAFGVIAVFGFIQFVEGNFITPKITGSKVSINTFIAILALIAFAMLWGIAGMIVALPVTATLKIIFDHTPGFKAIGFVMGEPVDYHLQSTARQRLKVWKGIRKRGTTN